MKLDRDLCVAQLKDWAMTTERIITLSFDEIPLELLSAFFYSCLQVYTVSQESRYVLLQGVPALGVVNDLIKLCALYGAVEEYRILHDYPTEDFMQVIWVKYQKLQAARWVISCYYLARVCMLCYS